MKIRTDLFLGDSKKMLSNLPDTSVDLIVTSPPYPDQRKDAYRGIHPDNYGQWFLQKASHIYQYKSIFIP